MTMHPTNPAVIEFTLTLRIPATRPVVFRVATLLRTFLDSVSTWHMRSRHRLALSRLDAHMLQDIGMHPATRARECAKPFWQA